MHSLLCGMIRIPCEVVTNEEIVLRSDKNIHGVISYGLMATLEKP